MAEPKVLVVDDDDAVRGVVGAGLGRAGIAVTVAASGEEGLQALAEDRFDLMVLDWHMPGLPGLEVLRTVRRDHPNVPVMICTGAGTADRDLALSLGAVDFFTKDRPVTEFVRRVQAILSGDFEPLEPLEPARPAAGGTEDIRAELGAISHELHNHLTVVLGHADLARAQLERSDGGADRAAQVVEDLATVVAAAERIGELSRRLRDLADGAAAARPSTEPPDAEGTSAGAKILLLEDDPDLRATAERLLDQEGYEVLAAADVATALDLLRADGPVDLCIADLQLPGGPPGEGAARLSDAAPSTPVLVMSGHGADVVTASSAPATASFLPKPFTRERLLDAVRDALGR